MLLIAGHLFSLGVQYPILTCQISTTTKASLSDAEQQSVADYLNATRYNDLVVDHIIRLFEKRNAIVLYFADHGEEVYNYRHQLGCTDLAADQ